MPFYGDVGRTYSRHEVTGALGIPPTSKGNWSNGYPRFDEEFFIFTTIDGDGRVRPTTGHAMTPGGKTGPLAGRPTIQDT